MLIDRSHKAWFAVSVAMVMIAAAVYAGYASSSPHGVSGGSVPGLLFGIVGSAMMIFAAFLAVRKRLPTWRVGSAQFWLRGHIWLGTVGFLFILFHSGFGWGGLLENLLWITFGWTVLTGFVGVVLQQVIPRLLTTQVPLETMVAQIPFLSRTMLVQADQLIAKQVGVLDVEFESLKPFAKAVLQQQRVLKRESDFPKELAKVYANVPQPEGDAKKSHGAESSAATPAKSPLPLVEGGRRPGEGPKANQATSAATAESAFAPKPKSPLELMRERAAAAKPNEATAASSPAPVSPTPAAPATATSDKPLSPIEMMRAKMAAKAQAAAPVVASTSPPDPASNGPAPSPSAETETPAPATATALTPLEIMKAKLAAAKGSPADKPVDVPKPLTVDKAVAVTIAPPVVKKPAPVTKPTTSPPNSAVSAPSSAKTPAPVPSAQLAALRDFHIRVVRPFLHSGQSPRQRLDEAVTAQRLFAQLNADLPAELHATVRRIEEFCDERRQYVAQQRLHRWLHWWLILHIPPSIALLVLFVAHVVVSLRVVPFGK